MAAADTASDNQITPEEVEAPVFNIKSRSELFVKLGENENAEPDELAAIAREYNDFIASEISKLQDEQSWVNNFSSALGGTPIPSSSSSDSSSTRRSFQYTAGKPEDMAAVKSLLLENLKGVTSNGKTPVKGKKSWTGSLDTDNIASTATIDQAISELREETKIVTEGEKAGMTWNVA